MLQKPALEKLLVCTVLLALALAGCDADNPCPVNMTNHSSHTLLVEVSQDSLFEMYEQAFYLIELDSAFVGYFPKGTVLWLQGDADHLQASDTSCFNGKPVSVTISGKTTFYFLDDGLGAPVLRVLQ